MSVSRQKAASLLEEFRHHVDENKRLLLKNQSASRNLRLGETEVEEPSRMLLLSVDGFYEGEREKGSEYLPLPEFGGLQKVEQNGSFITKNELFQENDESTASKQKGRQLRITLTGPAGAGKTTTLNRFARDATDGKISQIQDHDRLVHAVNCRKFGPDEELSVRDFLFRDMLSKPSKEAIEVGYQWMMDNPEKVTLTVDSLDTMRFDLESESRSVEYTDVATPGMILHNIFTGNLFNQSRILSSSREYAIRKYKGKLRADRIVSLAGLTEQSIDRLTLAYLGEKEGKSVLEILEKCPGLKELCKTPLFLILTLVGLKEREQEDDSIFIPTTMTGVMINLLNCLIRSKHARALGRLDARRAISAINKMKALALLGAREGRVIFTEEDIRKVGLTIEEILDLSIIIPGKEKRSQQLLERESVSYFSHQILQEVLCALKIIEMEIKDFRHFATELLHHLQYAVIRRLVCGILLDSRVFEEASDLLEVTLDIEAKRAILKEALSKQFPDILSQDNLKLLHAIHESGDGGKGIMPPQTDKIYLSNTPLMTSDMNAIGSSLVHCKKLTKLDISNCNLSSASVEAFASNLKRSNVKVKRLYASHNSRIGLEGLKTFGSVVRQCGVEKFEIGSSNVSSEGVESFFDGLGHGTVKKMGLRKDPSSHIPNLPMSTIRNIVPKITKRLDIMNYEFSQEERKLLQRTLDLLPPTNMKIMIGKTGHKESLRQRPETQPPPGIIQTRENLESLTPPYQPGPVANLYTPSYSKESMRGLHPVQNLQLSFVRDEISESLQSKETTGDSFSEAFSEEITPEGGSITAGGCSIRFRPATFTMTTKVTGKVEIDRKKWPANYTGITALFYIYTVNNLCKPAIVRMKSWCAPSLSKEGKAIMAHVLHYREDIESWEVIEELPLNDEYLFEFECKKFSPVQVALKDDQRGKERYLIDSTIFTCRNTFSVISRLHDDLLESTLEDKMIKRGFHPIIDFNPLLVTLSDNIRVLLFCAAPRGFRFPTNEPLNFTVSETFLCKKYSMMNAVLKKHTSETVKERLEMWGRIESGDQDVIDGPHSFYYEWEELTRDEATTRAIRHETGRDLELSEPPEKRTKRPTDLTTHTYPPQPVQHEERPPPHQPQATRQEITQIQKIHPTRKFKQPETEQPVSTSAHPAVIYYGHNFPSGSEELGTMSPSHLLQHSHLIQPQIRLPTPQPRTELTQTGKIHPTRVFKQTESLRPTSIGGATSTETQPAFIPYGYNFPTDVTSSSFGHIRPLERGFEPLAHDHKEAKCPVPGFGPYDYQTFALQTHHGQIPRTGGLQQHYPGLQPPRYPGYVPEQGRYEVPPMIHPALSSHYWPMHMGEMNIPQRPVKFPGEYPGYALGFEGHGFPNTLQATPPHAFSGMETIPKVPMNISTETRETSQFIPEPFLVVEGPRIVATWDAPENNHRFTYHINIYCNDQLCEAMPLRTPDTRIEYPVKPSCKYRCEVWAVNSRNIKSEKTWSNSVLTPDLQGSMQSQRGERNLPAQVQTLVSGSANSITIQSSQIYFGGAPKPASSVSAAASPTNSSARTGTPQEQSGPSVSGASTISSSTSGAAGGQREHIDATSVVTNIHVRRSTQDAYTAHLCDNGIYTIEEHRHKGRVLIINNEFQGTTLYREGSKVDVGNLEKLWTELGFAVVPALNLTAQQMLQTCRQFAQETNDVSLAVIIIMSHGEKAADGKEYFLGEDQDRAYVDEIIFLFTSKECENLLGIPKLFLFQACRGIGQDVVADAQTEIAEIQPSPQGPFFQERADMLVSFPTLSGNVALRNRFDGSWHMNAITHIFMRHAHDKHVLDMLTMVNDAVGKKISELRQIQSSNQLNFFRRNLFLFPGWPN